MIRRSKSWYTDKLSSHFKERYLDHLDVIPRLITPTHNKWAFDIPPLKTRVVLTCDDYGNITEERAPLRSLTERR